MNDNSKKSKIAQACAWIQSMLARFLPDAVARWIAILLTGAAVAAAVAAGVLSLDSCSGSYEQPGLSINWTLAPLPVSVCK